MLLIGRGEILNFDKKRFEAPMIAHWLPCHIAADHADADVESLFISRKSCLDADSSFAFSANIRGRPVRGKKLDLPAPYTSVVVQSNGQLADGEPEPLVVTQKLKSIILWNLSETPQVSDKIPSAFLWLHLADALHS
ncbi:hypothetical protein D915_006656 [Fasciola hepatica]|uniref:Uncharacterized protein n=1 Tax=Fasciola hepatica TaxID=6192 RepID=A0A2H1C7M3_FASHE|nr:hypothetical protein D915_006656 [Fasciola hepatica]